MESQFNINKKYNNYFVVREEEVGEGIFRCRGYNS